MFSARKNPTRTPTTVIKDKEEAMRICFKTLFSIRVIIAGILVIIKPVKTWQIYGVKKVFLLYLLAFFLALIGIGVLLYATLKNGNAWGYYLIGILGLVALYVLYLGIEVGFFRYRKYVKVSGVDVNAVITHFAEDGNLSLYVLAEASIGGKLVTGRLYGIFDQSFQDNFPDGRSVKVRYLATGEFLLYAQQN